MVKKSATEPTEKFDLDIWYNPTYENYYNLLKTLEDLGQDVNEFREEQTPTPLTSFFRFDLEKITIDFLPKLKGLSKFRDCHENKEVVGIEGVNIPILGINDLILDKEIDSRPKDLSDIKHLKEKRNN